MASASSCYECPVCHEGYTQPKILPCGHLVCQKCIMSWVKSKGPWVSCPLCRSSIMPPTAAGQIVAAAAGAVSAMPTDLYTASLVECHRILQEAHVCGLCDNEPAADYYCAQCSAKMCSSCERMHKRFPANKSHSVEQLNSLSAAKLAQTHQVSCQTHPDRQGELYCPGHQQVICILCGTTSHGSCANRQQLVGLQTPIRKELDVRVSRLRKKEADLGRKVQALKDHMDSTQQKINGTFDDIQQIVESQRKKFNKGIEAEKASLTQSLSGVENIRAALTQNASCLDPLVQSAAPGALLQMLKALRCRLNDLDQQTQDGFRKVQEVQLPDFVATTETLIRLKEVVIKFGNDGNDGMPIEAPAPQVSNTSDSVTEDNQMSADDDGEVGSDEDDFSADDDGEVGFRSTSSRRKKGGRKGRNFKYW